jgi:hypothetical protein
LPELWTCLELPNDLTGPAGAPVDHSPQLLQHALPAHPLVPTALEKWYTSLLPMASGPVTLAVAISGYVAE